MDDVVLTDEFGRSTVFVGEKLVEESTDSAVEVKPQWLEVDVWRTQGGSFVVQRTTCYRVRHLSVLCHRADGYDLSPATAEDTYACSSCNKEGNLEGGWGQDDRMTVDVYSTPQDLILGFQNDGRFNNLARAILADVSEKDDRVDAVWNTVIVP